MKNVYTYFRTNLIQVGPFWYNTYMTLPQLPLYVEALMETFRNAGYSIYVVGGPVRDMLLGKSPMEIDNWDFATNAIPSQMLTLLPTAKYENDYGTVLLPLMSPSDKHILAEITPFRHEGLYKDNRHPESVSWAKTIEEDLGRRDFTINAMAYDGQKLIDVSGSKEDLKNKIVKAVGDPAKRFTEDALRMLRAVRFATQLKFSIDPATQTAITEHAKLLQNISGERIRDEFLKILTSPNPADGVLLLHTTGLLQHILPEVEACFGVEQKSPERHHIHDVATHLIESLRHCPSTNAITRLGALIHDIGKPKTRAIDERGITTFHDHEVIGAEMAAEIADRLRLSKDDKERLIKLVRYHMFAVTEDQTDKTIRRFIRKVGVETIQDLLDIRTGDRLGSGTPATSWRTELFKKRLEEVQHLPFTVHDLNITGQEIMETLNLKPGPAVGKVLDKLFEMVDSAEVKNEKEELQNALSALIVKT